MRCQECFAIVFFFPELRDLSRLTLSPHKVDSVFSKTMENFISTLLAIIPLCVPNPTFSYMSVPVAQTAISEEVRMDQSRLLGCAFESHKRFINLNSMSFR